MSQHIFNLKAQEPFRLDLTVWGLRRRANNVMDRWVDNTWRRALTVENHTVEVVVSQSAEDHSNIQVQVIGPNLIDRQIKLLSIALEKCLGLSKNLSAYYEFAQKDKILNKLTQRFLGLKPPRFPTVFEAVVNGIACQQLSLDVGITLLNRLSENYGRKAMLTK
ncbi:MAG: hypothetical protein ACM3UY_07805 [Methanocella sp.]